MGAFAAGLGQKSGTGKAGIPRGIFLVFLLIIVVASLAIIVWREESRIHESQITGSTVNGRQDAGKDMQQTTALEKQDGFTHHDAKDSYTDINATAKG